MTLEEPRIQIASVIIGCAITKVARLRYEFDGAFDEGGSVQLDIGSNVLLLGTASDGEALVLSLEPWKDPFAGEVAVREADYLARHGRWILVDVSLEAEYAGLIGQTVTAIASIVNKYDAVVGLSVRVRDRWWNVAVDGDQIYVSWDDGHATRMTRRGVISTST